MKAAIYLIKDKDLLVELKEEEYDSELILQDLLAKYPNLLAGDQIDSADPRKWILVKREMSLSNETGYVRWSIDHLFLDQDGIPTIVEVKRSSDSRIRREVVGQMLDYAANAVRYWPFEDIQHELGLRCKQEGTNSEEQIAARFGLDFNQNNFWQNVKTNLQAGRIRMVFVADKIPSELKRNIEFLNEQMDPAQVLGIEIKQYIGEGLKSLVPRVIGQTEEAMEKKSTSYSREKLDKKSFYENLDDTGIIFYTRLLDYFESKEIKIKWGYAGFSANIVIDEKNISILEGYSLLAFGQSIYTITNNIAKYIKDPDPICIAFNGRLAEFGYFTINGTGMKWKIDRELSEKEFESFIDVLTFVINETKIHRLNE